VTGTVASYGVSPALPQGCRSTRRRGVSRNAATASARHALDHGDERRGSTTFALTIAVLGERATTDRADEQAGLQVHVMYVLPSDGVD
jgi:hypothetical protein